MLEDCLAIFHSSQLVYSQCVTELFVDICGRVRVWPVCGPKVEVDRCGGAMIEGEISICTKQVASSSSDRTYMLHDFGHGS